MFFGFVIFISIQFEFIPYSFRDACFLSFGHITCTWHMRMLVFPYFIGSSSSSSFRTDYTLNLVIAYTQWERRHIECVCVCLLGARVCVVCERIFFFVKNLDWAVSGTCKLPGRILNEKHIETKYNNKCNCASSALAFNVSVCVLCVQQDCRRAVRRRSFECDVERGKEHEKKNCIVVLCSRLCFISPLNWTTTTATEFFFVSSFKK